MECSTVKLGNHKGKTLPEIIFSDPDYFFWTVENDIFRGEGPLETEAKELNYKAQNIRIYPPGMVAEYWIHRSLLQKQKWGGDIRGHRKGEHKKHSLPSKASTYNSAMER